MAKPLTPRQLKKAALESLRATVLPLLREGNLTEAHGLATAWREEFSHRDRYHMHWPANQCLAFDFPHTQHSPEQRREMAVYLAFGALVGDSLDNTAAAIVTAAGGEFRCPGMDHPIKCGNYPGPVSPPEGRVWVYLNTLHNADHRREELPRYRAQSDVLQGVQVLAPKEDTCASCRGKTQFTWAEPIPNLPHHWGCGCIYVPWTKSWDDIVGP